MKHTIIVFKRDGRKYFECQWTDPITRRRRTKSTKKTTRRDAERWVAKHEDELLGVNELAAKATWSDFRERYESEALHGLSPKSVGKTKGTFNKVETILNPPYVDSLVTIAIEKFKSNLYSEGIESATIITHLIILRKALRWAHKRKLIKTMPEIDIPKKTPARRGRAVTQEEFDRMIAKVPEVVGDHNKESWEFLLNGLWWSGLRISEAMQLHWTSDKNIMVDYSEDLPMFAIQGHAEKGRKTRLLPMAPEFAQMIEGQERKGYVFNPARLIPPFAVRLKTERVGKVISTIGQKANVKVMDRKGKIKFASAHDLRRSFGLRWAQRVLPAVLMELMRHESIETTMKYYVGRNAQIAARAAWDAVAGITNTSTNILENDQNSALTQKSGA
ncbi:MAG: site-specific integrase [bacterium]|nr:site-specific integrase [bacterium]